MSRIITALAIAMSFCISTKSERILETVLDPVTGPPLNVAYEGKILMPHGNEPYLLSYDDISFSRIPYPIIDGMPARSFYFENGMKFFESAVFLVLGHATATASTRYVYKYTGSFVRVAAPGNIISGFTVFGSYIYFLSDVSGTTRLFRYSAGVVTEVPGSAIPLCDLYEMHVTEGYLYISGVAPSGPHNFVLRYDGRRFLTLPFTVRVRHFDGVYGVPGTDRVYFSSNGRILFYNGTTVRQVFTQGGGHIDARIWQNDLFFTIENGTPPATFTHLYRLSGSALSEVTLPAGYRVAPVPGTNPEIYRGLLHVGAEFSDGSWHLLRYNGASFDDLYTIPTLRLFDEGGIILFLRERSLIMQLNFPNGNNAFEYDGTDFTEIIAPAGRQLHVFINSTACNHLWLNQYTVEDDIIDPYRYAYAKESKDCPPPSPAPGPVAVIPVDFMIHERFEGVAIGKDRGWCWNEIIFGWDPPICDPPCPEPNYQIIMVGENNEIAWAEKFSKPSKFSVPLKDEQPFKTILSSIDNKTDLLIFDPDLVPKGIEEIKLFMLPKKGLLTISVSTRKKESVPLRVALLDEDGIEIWMQTFTAPFAMQITATVQKAGKTLVFSVPIDESKFITKAKDP